MRLNLITNGSPSTGELVVKIVFLLSFFILTGCSSESYKENSVTSGLSLSFGNALVISREASSDVTNYIVVSHDISNDGKVHAFSDPVSLVYQNEKIILDWNNYYSLQKGKISGLPLNSLNDDDLAKLHEL